MDIITIIAYRPDGIDTCRGCVMERYGSDFDFGEFDDLNLAAAFIASKRFGDQIKKDRAAPDWELTVLINGKMESSDSQGSGSYELTEPEHGLANLLVGKVVQYRAKLEEEHKEKLEADERRRKVIEVKRKVDAKEKRRAYFEELKKEFSL